MKKFILSTTIFVVTFVSQSFGQAGVLDPTFGANGVSVQQIDSSSLDVQAVQSDGKIIAAGQIRQNGIQHFGLARFKTAGTLDSSFGTNGITIIPTSAQYDEIFCLAIQSDDKILMGGVSQINSVYFGTVARCTANGILDTSFAGTGFSVLAPTSDKITTLAIRSSDGKILALTSMNFGSVAQIVRLNTNGSYDTGFGNQGVWTDPSNGLHGRIRSMVIQNDNKILGTYADFSTTYYPFTLVRFNEDASLDNTFGTNGIATAQFASNMSAVPNTLVLQSDGKIIAGGSCALSVNDTRMALARFNTNGALDAGFGSSGKVIATPGTLDDEIFSIAIQPSDNKIVVGGVSAVNQTTNDRFIVGRFNANGAIDNEFGTNGFNLTDFGVPPPTAVQMVSVLSDGKILATGQTLDYLTPSKNLLARYGSCSIAVTTQPGNQTQNTGGTATFTVASSSTSAIYQWQTNSQSEWINVANGGQYSGAQTNTLHIANLTADNDQQQFRSIATNGVCADTSAAAILTVSNTSGVRETSFSRGLMVYPNPVENILAITSKDAGDKIILIKAIDITGRVKNNVKEDGNNITINTTGWSEGIYMIQVITQNGQSATLQIEKK